MAQFNDRSAYPNITPASGDQILIQDVSNSDVVSSTTVGALSTFITTNVNTELDNKSNVGHTHQVSEITGFNAAVDARIGTNVVRTTGDQDILGRKNFTNLQINGATPISALGGTLTGDLTFNEGQEFPGTIQAGGTVNGTLGVTGDVTIGNTATQVEAFLQTIEDAGGRQTVSLAVAGSASLARTANELSFNGVPGHTSSSYADNGLEFSFAQALTVLLSSSFFSGFPDSNINITAALGNYYIIYIDINNWILFETATSTNFGAGETVDDFAFYITNVVANTGTFTTGGTAFLYSNVSGIDVLDFIDFFSTNTPVDTEVPWGASVGRTIMDSDGETERLIGASFRIDPNFRIPTFNWVHPADEFNISDIIRLRIWEDDVDQATTTPIIDVRKQISTTGSIGIAQEDLGTDGEISTVVLTESGITSLEPLALETEASVGESSQTVIEYTSPTLNATAGTSTITINGATNTGAGTEVNGDDYTFSMSLSFGESFPLTLFVATFNRVGTQIILSNVRRAAQFTYSNTPFVFQSTISVTPTRITGRLILTTDTNNLLYFATDQIRIDRSSQVLSEQFADPVDITLDGRADVGELEVEGQVILDGLLTFDPLIRNKAYTQTGTQLGLTGDAANLRFVILSDG